MSNAEVSFARLMISGQKSTYSARVDRVAVHCTSRPTLYFLSTVGSESAVAGLRSTLSGRRTGMTLQLHECKVVDQADVPRKLDGDRILLPGCKFKVHHQKLKYGLIHAMFVAQDPDFLLNVGPESLWNALNHPRFTTPLLREWMPTITNSLLVDRSLIPIHGMRCRCGLLDLDTSKLDAIVSRGIKSGKLPMRSQRPSVA